MKKLITICLVCVLLTAAASQGTTTPQVMTISFDENGNGNVNGTPLLWGVDTPPVGHETLYYVLPFAPVVEGEIRVMEPLATSPVISDVLRFVNVGEAAPIGRVYVYSDLPEAGETPELADTGIPSLWSPYNEVTEVGPEGSNGATWTPLYTGQPGYSGTYSVSYNFTSDVPEPATICLLGLGGLLLGRNRKFNKKQK